MSEWLSKTITRLGDAVYLIILGVISIIAVNAWEPAKHAIESLPLIATVLVVLLVLLIGGGLKFVASVRDLADATRKLDVLQRQSALDTELIALDAELLLLLPSLLTDPDLAKAAKDIVRAALIKITDIWPSKVQRAYVLLPNQAGDLLMPWCSFQMADETMKRASFQLRGNGRMATGVAGHAFIHKKTHVVHKRPDGSMDMEEYIEFDPARRTKPYESFVCVPMLAQTDECVGIMCLDSNTDHTVFDPPEITDLLVALGARLATLIYIYRLLERTHHKQAV
jgi:hypothetical protein